MPTSRNFQQQFGNHIFIVGYILFVKTSRFYCKMLTQKCWADGTENKFIPLPLEISDLYVCSERVDIVSFRKIEKNLCYANTFKWKLNLHLIVVFQTLFSQLLLPLKMFSHMQLFLSYIKFSICLQHTLPQGLKKKRQIAYCSCHWCNLL